MPKQHFISSNQLKLKNTYFRPHSVQCRHTDYEQYYLNIDNPPFKHQINYRHFLPQDSLQSNKFQFNQKNWEVISQFNQRNKMLNQLGSQQINFSKNSYNLIRSQSINLIYSSQRKQMLKKINDRLQNQIRKSQNFYKHQQINQKKVKNLILIKLDRLEKYLSRIKQQRQKQIIPMNHKTKSQNKNQPKIVKSVVLYQDKKEDQTQAKNKYGNALIQLQKIKKDLTSIRQQAQQVKRKNSVAVNRSKSKQKTNNPTFKLNYNLSTTIPHSNLQIHQNLSINPNQRSFQNMQLLQNITPQSPYFLKPPISSNTQTSLLQSNIQPRSNHHFQSIKGQGQRNKNIISKSPQKPKVKFTFNANAK